MPCDDDGPWLWLGLLGPANGHDFLSSLWSLLLAFDHGGKRTSIHRISLEASKNISCNICAFIF